MYSLGRLKVEVKERACPKWKSRASPPPPGNQARNQTSKWNKLLSRISLCIGGMHSFSFSKSCNLHSFCRSVWGDFGVRETRNERRRCKREAVYQERSFSSCYAGSISTFSMALSVDCFLCSPFLNMYFFVALLARAQAALTGHSTCERDVPEHWSLPHLCISSIHRYRILRDR